LLLFAYAYIEKSLKQFGVCVKTSRKFCLHDNNHKGLVNVDNEEDHSSSHDISVICDEGTENKQNSSVSVINDNTAIPQQRNATSDCVEVDKVRLTDVYCNLLKLNP